jgi:hypothetical protein
MIPTTFPSLSSLSLKSAAIGLAALVLAACQAQPPAPPLGDVSFTNLPPIQLAVSRIEVVDEYTPPLRAPNVEHEMPVSPAAAANRWADQRLRAVGGPGVARVIISDASVVENRLPVETGVRGTFTTNQSARYDARVHMRIEIKNDRGFTDAFAEAGAARSRTISETASVYDKDKLFIDLVTGLMSDLNAQLDGNIASFLRNYRR